jgi:hypothetical protein
MIGRDFARRVGSREASSFNRGDGLLAAATSDIEARVATSNRDDFPMDAITVEQRPVGR